MGLIWNFMRKCFIKVIFLFLRYFWPVACFEVIYGQVKFTNLTRELEFCVKMEQKKKVGDSEMHKIWLHACEEEFEFISPS